jgi:hypothetical protein
MQARYAFIDALLKIHTQQAVETALAHSIDMTRLNGRDNQGLRNIAPSIILRPGKDQECYEFTKWWALTEQAGTYNRADPHQPFLNSHGQDSFELVVEFFKPDILNLAHLVALTLLKIRFVLDLKTLHRAVGTGTRPRVFTNIMQKDREQLGDSASALLTISGWVEKVVENLFDAVNLLNRHYWGALVQPGDLLTVKPNGYMLGSVQEMQLKLQECYNAWVETPGAIAVIGEMMESSRRTWWDGCRMQWAAGSSIVICDRYLVLRIYPQRLGVVNVSSKSMNSI